MLIDLVHLSKYTLGDRDLECELLALFRSQSGVYLNRLEAAASLTDWKEAAHSLKGSAKGIGAWAIADHAETAEQLTAIGEPSHAAALRSLRTTLDETIAHITILLD
jgi:HPt (histidine-containing phosphotransfer) domain-containing protein